MSKSKKGIPEYGQALQQMRNEHQTFYRRGEDAWKQYVPKHENAGSPYRAKRFNIFWSNVNTIRPNLYFQRPKLRVQRRILESQPVSIVASESAQRVGTFNLDEQNKFNSVMSKVVTDRLVCGRGQVWMYYMPVEGIQRYELFPTPDGMLMTRQGLLVDQSTVKVKEDSYSGQLYYEEELLQSEKICLEHVHWKDFVHSFARNWQEVNLVARAVYLSQDKAEERFGKAAQDLTFSYGYNEVSKGMGSLTSEKSSYTDNACVWELWDRERELVVYLSEDGKVELKSEDPPISFKNGFPCPEPLTATTSEDDMLPYSDYYFYQQQAKNLNTLTDKINNISSAINWAGLYNPQHGIAIKQLLESGEGTFLPAKDWSTFAQQGGLKGAMDYIPIDALQQTLLALYQAREFEKSETYEISGIADILRGATNPNETATAQKTKASYASLRLAEQQQEIQEFIKEVYEIKVEACVERFSITTIANMVGNYAQHPLFSQAVELLKNDKMRTFAIEIETDATLKANEDTNKQLAVEFMGAFAQGMQMFNATRQTNPEAVPVAAEMLKFIVRQYTAGRDMELQIEQAMDTVVQQTMQSLQQPPQPPQPTPKEQMDMQKIQLEQQKQQIEMAKFQAEDQRKQAELGIKAQDSETKKQKVIGDLTLEAQRLQSDTEREALRAYSDRFDGAIEASNRYGAR